MKNFKKILLLSNFLLIIGLDNSFAEFKFSEDFETASDFNKTAPIRKKKINVINDNNDNYEDFQYKKAEEENKILSDNEYNNIRPFDEYFQNNKIKNHSIQTIEQNNQTKNPSKKIIKTKKNVKYLKSKNLLTIGSYFGIDYLNANLRFREMSIDNEVYPYNSPDLKNGFGLKYFYAVNFNNLFLAPEIFYEKIGVKNKYSYNRFLALNGSGTYTDKRTLWGYKFMEIHQRFGGKINLGYDFNSNFAPYIFGGLSYIDFSNLASPYTIDQRNQALQVYGYDVFQIKKGRKLVPFFGYGLKIKLSNRFYLNAEYHILDFMVKTKSTKYTPLDNTESSKNADFINLDNSLRIFKAGLLYNF
ncbi:MAG: outer membrane protein [Rickettsiales bacterium]